MDLVREHHRGRRSRRPHRERFKLADAQVTVARMYGFPSWPRLRHHVELVTTGSAGHPTSSPPGRARRRRGRADELLRLACLNYGNDSPDAGGRPGLLAEHPGAVPAVDPHRRGDRRRGRGRPRCWPPTVGGRPPGGPFDWAPLLYLTYSRLRRRRAAATTTSPSPASSSSTGRPRRRLPLGGAAVAVHRADRRVRGGEQGAPAHHDELVLARLLLEAGAEANDSQTIYDRGLGDVPRDDTAYLALLLDFGLGAATWSVAADPRRRPAVPRTSTAEALQHAAEAGLARRVRLLLDRGVDPDAAAAIPPSAADPVPGCLMNGNLEIAGRLAEAGAGPTGSVRSTGSSARALAAIRTVGGAARRRPHAAHRAHAKPPDLVAHAAGLGRADAVRLLVALGLRRQRPCRQDRPARGGVGR